MANDTSLKNKRILILQQRNWGVNIGHSLAKKLYKEGCHLAALTVKKSTHEFFLNQKDVDYQLIVNSDVIKEDPRKFLGSDKYSLEQICDDLGVDSIWPLVQSARNHVKSYKDKYYYGFKQNIADDEIVDYIKAVYKNISNIFNQFNPDIVIAPNFVALQQIMLSLYSKKHGVKMIGWTDSKIRDIHIFVNNHYENSGRFFTRLKELNAGAHSQNFDKARDYIKRSEQKLITPQSEDKIFNSTKLSLLRRVRQEIGPYYRAFRYWIFTNKNKLKNIKVTLDDLSPYYILRDHYAHKKYTKFANQYDYYDLANCKKYIYFPLQYQPEATIDVIAPRFNNQIETARQVALSMPGDYTLVVKEHPAMLGYRPDSYLEKIARTPNVKLIDYRISSEKVLRGASMVISPSGTTLAEAAFLKKPAIQLGNLGTLEVLPNVFKHSDLSSLSLKIKKLLSINLNTSSYDHALLAYVTAAYDVGFDFDYISAWERGEGDMEQLWQIYKREILYTLTNR